MKDFKNLKVWEKAHALTLMVYKSTEHFPKQELYALTNQIQRAVVSIPANIAKGCGKDSDAELKKYFLIAMGHQANWNICFCWHVTLVILKQIHISRSRMTSSKYAKAKS